MMKFAHILKESLMFDIVQRYLEPNRYYHTTTHISNMVNNSLKYYNFTPKDDIRLHFAIYFHDAVYDPLSVNNESDGVALFLDYLYHNKLSYDKSVITVNELASSVSTMIMATKHHDPLSEMSKYLIDLDLWELANKKKYKENLKLIRQEFSMFDDQTFNSKRKIWLDTMILKPNIYFTDYCIDNDFEKKARKNLVRELKSRH